MLILKRFTPYWTSLVIMGLLLWLLLAPTHWLLILIAIVSGPVIATLIVRQPQWRSEYLWLTVPMLLLVGGGYTFLLIQETLSLQIAAIICTGVFFFLFEKNLSVFLFQPAKYIPFSLEHIVTYCNVIA